MNQRLFIFFSIIIFLSSNCIAQINKIEWGPELEGDGMINIIGEIDDHLYATQTKYKLFSKNYSMLKINKNTLQVVDRVRFKEDKDDGILLHSALLGDKIHSLRMREETVEKVVYNLEMEKLSNEVLIKLSKKSLYADLDVSNHPNKNPYDLVSILVSRDNSKTAIKITKAKKESTSVSYYIFDCLDGYKSLYNTNFSFEKKKYLEVAEHEDLQADGTLNILVKQYNNRKGKEHKKKKPDYNFFLLKIGIDGEINDIDLPRQKSFWTQPRLTNSNDGSILVASMTQAKPKGGANGYQIIKFSPDNTLEFDKTHPLVNTDNKKLSRLYEVSDFVALNNDRYVIMSTNDIVRSTTNGNSTLSRTLSEDILFDGFDDTGNHVFSKKIYRDVFESGSLNVFTGVRAFYNNNNNNGLSVFYNTTEKNAKTLNNPKQKSEKLPSKKNVIVSAHLSIDGVFSFNKISSGNGLNFWTGGSKLIGSKFYFIGAKSRKTRKMRIGLLN